MKILVVEDDVDLCRTLALNLTLEGYEALTAYSAEEALQMDLKDVGLVLLDIMMGEMNGLEMARRLKENPQTASIPVIFCTAKDSEEDMLTGFGYGADDYICKPYSVRNVLARVKAVLRRTEAKNAVSGSAEKGLYLDKEFKRCMIDGEEIPLARKEFEVLALLAAHPGKIFSREEILKRVWPDDTDVSNRTVDVNITRLRQKLGDYGECIITRSGYGYGYKD